MMHPDVPYWFILTFCSGLHHAEIHDLIRRWTAGEERPLMDLFDAPEDALESLGMEAQYRSAIARARKDLDEAFDVVEQCELAGIDVVLSGSPEYPRRIQETLGRTHPPMLFCAGNAGLFARPCVSMIGARKAKQEALDFTQGVAHGLGDAGVCVVSGFADGVDRCASKAALEAGGDTILFLAQGLLTFKPTDERFSSYLDTGHLLAVSARRPREPWQTRHAMQRNGLITAASNETVVSQCGLAGGTWEASRMGLRQKKRVWLRADSDPALGHRELARLGAHVVHWPRAGAKWVEELTRRAACKPNDEDEPTAWSEFEALELLRTASASQISDVAGIAGNLPQKIVRGRKRVALRRIADLENIRGLTDSDVLEVAKAFGLPSPRDQMEQYSLFPDMDNHRNLRAQSRPTSPSSRPFLSEQTRNEILEFAAGAAGYDCATAKTYI